jgi:hypothetical protein
MPPNTACSSLSIANFGYFFLPAKIANIGDAGALPALYRSGHRRSETAENGKEGGESMGGSRADLPATVESKEAIVREADWTGIHVGFETYNEDSDIAPLYEGLPDDRCQCPHWGYVFEGRMHVRYADHEEVFEAGDAYYVSPGHTPFMEAGTEILVFSPKDAYRKTQEVTEVNFEARQEAP